MATQMQVGDVMSCRAWATLGNQAAVNTYNFEVVAVSGASQTDQDLADGIDSFFASLYIPALADSATYNGAQVYFIKRGPPGLLVTPVSSVASSGPGTGGTNAIPKNAAFIMKYSTNKRGPGGRGRIFIPFVGTPFVGPTGDPTTAWGVLLNSYCANLLLGVNLGSGGNTASLKYVLATRPPLPAPVTTQQIVSCQSAGKVGQMHKRGDYGRPNASPI